MNDLVVVQSAISSFNNAALATPDFLWSAVLALPIFIIFWIFARDIAARFMKDDTSRNYKASFLTIIVLFVWILCHENFNVLRDFSWIGILCAGMLYMCAIFLSRQYYDKSYGLRLRVSNYLRAGDKWKKRNDIMMPTIIVIIAAACAIGNGWAGMALQGGAVAIGWITGWALNKFNRVAGDPKILVGIIMIGALFGMVMQPEFFRFGQLGNLTGIHMISLLSTAGILSGYLALNSRFARPKKWLNESAYNKIKWLLFAVALLALFLFLITESALVFVGFAFVIAMITILCARHRPTKDAEQIRKIRHNLWFLSIGMFGFVANLPILICVAIILWRNHDHSQLL